jgi:hypothetical protein
MIDLGAYRKPIQWFCPRCVLRDLTLNPEPRFHNCSSMSGLTMPMLREGERAKVEVNEREDYIGAEDVQLVDGVPVMNVTVTRDSGQDVAVYAPTAHGGSHAPGH